MTKVSVIMLMKNAENYVAEAIDSILGQSYNDFEIIVVDDCSEDSSRRIINSYSDSRIRLMDGPCEGVASALNQALGEARGMYICRCDADDYFPHERLELQVEWLDNHNDYGAVCGSFSSIDPKGAIVADFDCGAYESDITDELLSAITRTSFCTFLIRSEILRQTGGFRIYFITGEDIDMQLRLVEDCKVWYQPIITYFYRLHNASITHTQASSKREFYEETARLFRRQRENKGKDNLQLGNPPKPPSDVGGVKSSRSQIQGILLGKAWRLHDQGRKREAVSSGMKACFANPLDLPTWRSFLLLVIRQA